MVVFHGYGSHDQMVLPMEIPSVFLSGDDFSTTFEMFDLDPKFLTDVAGAFLCLLSLGGSGCHQKTSIFFIIGMPVVEMGLSENVGLIFPMK